jgi:hypothetical protein
MRNWKVFAVLLLAVSLTGCAARQKTVTNLPAGVTMTEAQQWDSAVANLDRIASFTSSARQTVITLNKQGVFPDGPLYVSFLQGIGKVDELQLSASTILKAAPGQFSASTKSQVASLLQQISQQLNALNTNGVAGIKNPSSQQQVTSLLANIGAAVTLILTL